jgi:hypothetical protein
VAHWYVVALRDFFLSRLSPQARPMALSRRNDGLMIEYRANRPTKADWLSFQATVKLPVG